MYLYIYIYRERERCIAICLCNCLSLAVMRTYFPRALSPRMEELTRFGWWYLYGDLTIVSPTVISKSP